MIHQILAINPGSTSTKIAVFHNTRPVFLRSVNHRTEDLQNFKRISDQFNFRRDAILNELSQARIDTKLTEIVIGRGGLLKPLKSGVYIINDNMIFDLTVGAKGEHASNLGGLIAEGIAKTLPSAKAYIADPVVVDEMNEVARYTGHPKFRRHSIFHALNHKATGRAYARLLNKKYEELNLVIAHLGGGISVAAHCQGKIVDVNQALDGEGPFSPERTGSLPMGELAAWCFSGQISLEEMKHTLAGKGGYIAYFGTNNAYEIELMARDGDEKARIIQDAMAYQIGKEIGAYAAVLKGKTDAIILTGGMAHNTAIVEYIKSMVSFIAPVVIYPGEDEMHSLAMNAFLVAKGEITPREYSPENIVDTSTTWDS